MWVRVRRAWSMPGVIPAGNEPGGCLQTFGDCREVIIN